MKFTQAAIDKFKLSIGKLEHIEFDDKMHGFGLRLRAGGHRSYIVQYKIGAKQRRITIGDAAKVTLDDARREAQKIFGKIASGIDPASERAELHRAASHTLGATIAKYLDARAPALKPRTLVETRRHFEVYWKPLHDLGLNNIIRAHVAAELTTIAKDSGPVTANRARASLSTLFLWAIGEGLCEVNPVAGTNQQKERGPRERSLSDAEVAAVWLAAPESDYGRIVRLILLTGCRREEIGGLEWSEIDIDGRSINLPPERTKNGKAHSVPLTDVALAIVNDVPRRDRDCVFGLGQGGFSGWSRSKADLTKQANLKEPWTLHDLRRTVRTGLGKLGVQPHIAEAVLNHLPPVLVRTYDRNTYAAEKRDALERWASHLTVAVAQATGANVRALRNRDAAAAKKR
jgi:integrase